MMKGQKQLLLTEPHTQLCQWRVKGGMYGSWTGLLISQSCPCPHTCISLPLQRGRHNVPQDSWAMPACAQTVAWSSHTRAQVSELS